MKLVSPKDIAQEVQRVLEAAMAAGELPAFAFTLRTEANGRQFSLTLTVIEAPFLLLDVAALLQNQLDDNRSWYVPLNPEFCKLKSWLKALLMEKAHNAMETFEQQGRRLKPSACLCVHNQVHVSTTLQERQRAKLLSGGSFAPLQWEAQPA